MKTCALIVAGGSGVRAGGTIPKQYQLAGGKAVIAHTAAVFLDHPQIDLVQVVIGASHQELYSQALEGLDLPPPVTGGNSRQQSVLNGLEALAGKGFDKVLVHDAARPFVSPGLITAVVTGLASHDGVIPAIAVTDTIKQHSGGLVVKTIPRDTLKAVQTPQGFDFNTLVSLHRRARDEQVSGLTDDASVLEWAGLNVAIIEGEADNIKITTAGDMKVADRKLNRNALAELADIRTGQGFDVHAFGPGNHVVLCGLKIPHTASLKGHSDADVAMHALTDAVLGAIGEGDIGAHFPPDEEQWRGCSSDVFLQKSVQLVKARGGALAHCDLTVICEMPRLRPHIEAMRNSLAGILELPASRISIKATTTESLGFTGRKEGIAAIATATVRLPFGDE